jgi:DNA repair protein RecO (recombination protein O)
MAVYQTTGIVLGRTNYGEADRIVRLLTREHGKVSAIARGVRKIKSRSGGHLEPLGEVALSLAEGRGSLEVITGARLAWYPHRLAGNYAALTLALDCAALVNRVAQEGHAQPELYAHLREGLGVFDEAGATPLTELWFKLRLLQLTGLRPELTVCLTCGRRDAAADYRFDAARGGIVCAVCANGGMALIASPAIKLWRLLSDYPYTTICKISDAPVIATATLPLCDGFLDYHAGKR